MGGRPALSPHPHLRYRKAFDVEPSLHSGINAAVLLIAAGQRFEDSEELQLIGESVPQPSSHQQALRGPGESMGRKDTGLGPGPALSPFGPVLPEPTSVPEATPVFLKH